jgi:hypothetical protein
MTDSCKHTVDSHDSLSVDSLYVNKNILYLSYECCLKNRFGYLFKTGLVFL